jgi:catechol 2,3-dioxygenase-like lactoylglutathione lyase family enzyme
MDAALRFYVDGIGLEVIFDVTLKMDAHDLLGIHTERVRTIFLGNTSNPASTRLELVDFGEGYGASDPPRSGVPQRGLTLISFQIPVQPTLARLAELGLGGEPRIMPTPAGGLSATVVDPDGVIVELLDQPVSFG